MKKIFRLLRSYNSLRWLSLPIAGLVALYVWIASKIGMYGATIIYMEAAMILCSFAAGYIYHAAIGEKINHHHDQG